MSGADTLADHAVLDFVDVHAHADRAILLLQQARVLLAQHTRRRHEDVKRERLPGAVTDAVAVVVAPAAGVQDAGRLRGIEGELADLGVPDPEKRGHRSRWHFAELTKCAAD